MARDVDERKKRKALRQLRKAAELAEAGLGPPLSDWERDFLEEVETRIETYGSAFADPSKGNLEDPLSALQSRKLKEIDKKARGKGKETRPGRKTGPVPPHGRDIHADIEADGDPGIAATPRESLPETRAPRLVETGERPAREPDASAAKPRRAPVLRLIKGGAQD